MSVDYTEVYSRSADMTFIMENCYSNGELKSIECKGWYFGEPDHDKDTEYFGKLKATFPR